MSYDLNNIFARILRQEIPCQRVFEDDFILAFHDIHPKAPIHILVIPKGEYVNSQDFHENASAEQIVHFYKKVSEIASASQLDQDGYRIIANTGANSGQEVEHYHIHILGGRPLGPMIVPHTINM